MTLFQAWVEKGYPQPPFRFKYPSLNELEEDDEYPDDPWITINAIINHSPGQRPNHFSDISFYETQNPLPGTIEVTAFQVKHNKPFKF